MRRSPLEQKIEAIITPVVNDQGLRLVTLELVNDSKAGLTLRIMAENPETRKLVLDDCAALSREISTILEVEDPIEGAYNLEVSSPGIDRPLISQEDFKDHIGYEAKVEIDPPLEDGQKRFRGRIKEYDKEIVTIDTDQGEKELPFQSIKRAKLVLTDELIEKTK